MTYEQLIEAANLSKSYQAGVKVGKAAAEAALATIGGLPLAALGAVGVAGGAVIAESLSSLKKKGGEEKYTELLNEHQRFVAMSNGLIYGCLGAKGIIFQIESRRSSELASQFDTYLQITGRDVSEYILRYLYLTKEDPRTKYIAEDTAKRLIEELVFLKPSKERKVSIVTNYEESYDFMLTYKDKISYNGELSIILVDIQNVKLIREDYISHYIGEDHAKEMLVV